MSWTWRLETASGTEAAGPAAQVPVTHPTQSDAESWIGENWRGLAAEGVAKASLFCDGKFVYGPMALAE